MRKSFLRGLCTVAFLSAAVPAQADIVIQISTNGTNFTTLADAPSANHEVQFSGPLPSGLNLNLDAQANSPGLSNESNLTGKTVTSITNTGSDVATVYFKFSDTDFTAPANPGNVTFAESINGTITSPGPGNALTFQSFADPANGQATTTGPSLFTLPALTPNLAGQGPLSTFSDSASQTIASGLNSGYSLTQLFQVTLNPGSTLDFNSNTTIVPAATDAVPLPASSAMGLVLLAGCAAWRLRRSLGKATA